MSRKVNVSITGFVHLPVKVKLDVLIHADDDASIDRAVKLFAKGEWNGKKYDVEDVSVESAEFYGLLDADESLVDQVSEHLEGGGKNVEITILNSEVTDSR